MILAIDIGYGYTKALALGARPVLIPSLGGGDDR